MTPGTVFRGFEPDARFDLYLSTQMNAVLDEAPADSIAQIDISKASEKYSANVKIYSTERIFEASSTAAQPYACLQGVLIQLRGQIREWRLDRFLGSEYENTPLTMADNPYAVDDQTAELLQMVEQHRKVFPKKKLRVLLVDDDSISITPLKMSFRNLGCEVKVVDDGYQAITEILKEPFDLMVLDWTMPGLNGGDTIRVAQKNIYLDSELKRLWEGRPLPVVTYSGRPREKMDLPKCQNFRFIDHWQKPIRYPKLKLLTSDLLERIQAE